MPDTFADWLRSAMAAKGWNASDLAREMWGTITDTRGQVVARNRDRIGTYLKGRSYPSPETLTKLSAALGEPPGNLLAPLHRVAGVSPVGTFVWLSNGSVRVRIDQEVSHETAMAIVNLLDRERRDTT